MKFPKALAILLTVILGFTLFPVLSSQSNAGEVITSCVNLSNVRKNESGSGYFWDNRNDILTLSGVNIDTTDEYGLKLPAGATVELKGTNYITASKVGVACYGTTVFTGTGTLIITAGETGLYNNSQDSKLYTRITSGTYSIRAGDCAVKSPNAGFYFVGGTLDLKTTQNDGFAINGRTVKLMGGTVTADNAIHASYLLQIKAVDLTAAADRSALSSDHLFQMDTVSIRAGDSLSSLTDIDEYSNQKCVILKSTAAFWGPSYIFGDSVPVFVDYILVALLILAITALIVIPIVRKKISDKKISEAVEEYEKEHTVERRSDKKTESKSKKKQ